MLKYRNINFLFFVLFFLFGIGYIFYAIPLWPILLLVLGWLAILFYGSYFIGSRIYLNAVCQLNTREKIIALSFDDGPTQYTKSILEILARQQVKATFFCIGKNIEHHVETLRQIDREGHIIGNHSYIHNVSFDFWSSKKVQEDLVKTEALIEQIIGKKLIWFRPPFGVTNPNIAKAVHNLSYKTIGWSIRSFDTVNKNSDKLFLRLMNQLRPGAIVLFHDTCEVTVEVLPRFIEAVKKEGYDIVALDKYINLKPYANR